jgi:hypothetical protein
MSRHDTTIFSLHFWQMLQKLSRQLRKGQIENKTSSNKKIGHVATPLVSLEALQALMEEDGEISNPSMFTEWAASLGIDLAAPLIESELVEAAPAKWPEERDSKFEEHARAGSFRGPSRETMDATPKLCWVLTVRDTGRKELATVHMGTIRVDERPGAVLTAE